MGTTDKYGNIAIQRGLSGRDLVETYRHEVVHSALGSSSAIRANARIWIYTHSAAWRYAEEAVAEAYATRSLIRGLSFPFGGYVSPVGLTLEVGGITTGAYLTYAYLSTAR
jgi:hypothetical protein